MEARTKTVALHPVEGQTLKQYRVEALLGQGGMGEVYKAHDLKLQRPVALKILPREFTADPERWKRFMMEARTAARINHPAIAQVYDIDEQDGVGFIAMELVEGKTIRQLIQNQELDLLGAIDIAIQVAGGLAKAHEMGILHRDIKPANVIQTPDGHVKILDFGLAKLLSSDSSSILLSGAVTAESILAQTQAGEVKGTPAYMSPEQVKAGALDARSDLFSLGAMFFEMATYEAPFQRQTLVETMHAVAFEETPSMHLHRPNLPADLQRIVARCLGKRPEDRYASARELIRELRVLQRETASGRARALPLRERLNDALERLAHLNRAQYLWLISGLAGLALVFYLRLRLGFWTAVFLVMTALYLFRYVRHQPQRALESFVRKISKIPEVSLVVAQDRKLVVVVDRPASQLYGRINKLLNAYNRKLFFGAPMSVTLRHDLTPEQQGQLLAAPGVQFVREEAVQPALRLPAPPLID